MTVTPNRVFLNGETVVLQRFDTLTDLLAKQAITTESGYVIAVNNTIVPNNQWSELVLQDGDHISLFQAIAGG